MNQPNCDLRPRGAPAVRARRSLVWALAAFGVLQVAPSIVMDRWLPELRDPEYGAKLHRLRALQAARPGEPLILVIGSSRSAMGLRPDSLPDCRMADGRTGLVFNFGMTGYGPVQELALLDRLLRDGVRPDQVMIEVHPLLLHQENGYGEEYWLNVNCLDWDDLCLVSRYASRSGQLQRQWWESRLWPWHSRRFLILDRFAPRWAPPETRQNAWSMLDARGWLPHHRQRVTAEEYRRGQEHARREYEPAIKGFRVTELADRAMCELLELCSREAIAAALFVMPEGSEFRSWYQPAARGEVEAYLGKLSRQYGCPYYDAAAWCADDDFWDGHHLLPDGARRFSAKFGRQALQPTLETFAERKALVARRAERATRRASTQ